MRMVTLAISYPTLNLMPTILIFMALVTSYRTEAPKGQAVGLAHVPWPATRRIEPAVTLIRGSKVTSEHTVGVRRLENEDGRIVRAGIASLLKLGIHPTAAIRSREIASDCRRQAEPAALAPGRPVRRIADHPVHSRIEVRPC